MQILKTPGAGPKKFWRRSRDPKEFLAAYAARDGLDTKSHSTTTQLIPPVRAGLHGGGGPWIGEVTCAPRVTTHKRDQIKMRDYMDRRVTPPEAGYLTYLGSPTFM